jgi:hypothetical protein
MARAIRVPGLVDLVTVDDPAAIRALAAEPRLDRRFTAAGPLVNRVLARRVRSLLQVGGLRLPAVAPREDPARATAQAALEGRLDPAGRPLWTEADVEALAGWVRGAGHPSEVGPLAQGVVGRLFDPAYRADFDGWEAALLLDAAPRARNPLTLLWWRVSGRLARARRLLAARVGGDPGGVHATGIAIHTLVRSLERLRALVAEPGARDSLGADAVLARCLAAPRSVMRQATDHATTAALTVRPGTLVVLELDAALARQPGPELALMTGSWSRCPAHRLVPALLLAVWERARAEGSAP